MTSNRECRQCVFPKEYKDPNLPACSNVTACAAGEYELKKPTPVSDRVCKKATKCSTKQHVETAV